MTDIEKGRKKADRQEDTEKDKDKEREILRDRQTER